MLDVGRIVESKHKLVSISVIMVLRLAFPFVH
jgi:hypothetical protein